MSEQESKKLSRREMLKLGLMAGGATLIGAGGVREAVAMSCHDSTIRTSCGDAIEVYPTSPLIGGRITETRKGKGNQVIVSVNRKIGEFDAFTQELPIPTALRPVEPFGNPNTNGIQDFDGQRHQVGVNDPLVTGYPGWIATPMYYRIKLQVASHKFTNLKAVPINAAGNVVLAPPAFQTNPGALNLPDSTIWGFNGQFPGPMINAEYGRSCLVRFENELTTITVWILRTSAPRTGRS